MILFKKELDLATWLDSKRGDKKSIGFVPTMGALHAGHLSLIEGCRQNKLVTCCSIFVNPTQFNDKTDFEKYPSTIEKDIYQLEKNGCDILFLPSVKEIYHDEISTKKHYDLGYLETILEGKYRPGHFQGVCMVMHRLLGIVKPDRLYLGQKDYQQCLVIKRLIDLIGMTEIEIIISPTLREPNGLAMSSRNMRLTEESRRKAATIFKTLKIIKQNFQSEDFDRLKEASDVMLKDNDFKTDYIEIADATNLFSINKWDGKKKLVALIAATIDGVRLIDNMLLN